MTEIELQKLCCEWQGRLRVLDWDVELVFVDRFNMGDKEGECVHHLRQKTARIRLLPEDERQKSAVGTQDIETRLVHELIHLLVAPFEPEDEESAQYVAMEQAVNSLALALVGLKRAGGILEGALRREQRQGQYEEPDEFVQIRREVAEELLEGIREADYTLKTVSTPEQCVEARQKGTLPVWSVLESAMRKAEHREPPPDDALYCPKCVRQLRCAPGQGMKAEDDLQVTCRGCGHTAPVRLWRPGFPPGSEYTNPLERIERQASFLPARPRRGGLP